MNSDFLPSSRIPLTSKQIGTLGEQLVMQWLQQQGWEILQHQYYTRWGEIDIIALQEKTESHLIFVEVKTRSQGNWDEEGLLAISATKQQKLIQSAQMFLSQSPTWADCCCRFDVALVRWDRLRGDKIQPNSQQLTITLGQPLYHAGGRLMLQQYIESAFYLS